MNSSINSFKTIEQSLKNIIEYEHSVNVNKLATNNCTYFRSDFRYVICLIIFNNNRNCPSWERMLSPFSTYSVFVAMPKIF